MRTSIVVIFIFCFHAYAALPADNLGRNIQHCPHIRCAAILVPLHCRRPTYLQYQGRICLGCDRNICLNGYTDS
ncbi:hypothetical protein CHS0354_037944 [Potamilus streckersoni]|uniref:Uncharacterized protein n=1 Tax=Potamilus streckersoni TaxID=2493646 RepID=A0AAE0W8R5_9BIVA|nr:hypothetical protein CHS0354_037944 [Potamilus streckersoni]